MRASAQVPRSVCCSKKDEKAYKMEELKMPRGGTKREKGMRRDRSKRRKERESTYIYNLLSVVFPLRYTHWSDEK